MSVLILGKTICPICKQVLNDGNNIFSFPAFVINTRDPLYYFSDASFHITCLNENPVAPLAKKYSELFVENLKPMYRKCIVSGEVITDYDNNIFVEYLTSNKENLLHQFNFIHIDKRNLYKWDKANQFKTGLINLIESGYWQEQEGSHYLEHLIKLLP